jgi:hypothetical protein
MKSPAQFPGILTDEIITRGAPTKLISDITRVETSKEVRSILRTYGDNFRMNTHSGRYGAAYNMVGLRCLRGELSLLPKNPTEAKLQATSTRGESTEPT